MSNDIPMTLCNDNVNELNNEFDIKNINVDEVGKHIDEDIKNKNYEEIKNIIENENNIAKLNFFLNTLKSMYFPNSNNEIEFMDKESGIPEDIENHKKYITDVIYNYIASIDDKDEFNLIKNILLSITNDKYNKIQNNDSELSFKNKLINNRNKIEEILSSYKILFDGFDIKSNNKDISNTINYFNVCLYNLKEELEDLL
jgi:hypothetical protein